ncbi:MAG: hypothetical protein HOJ35_06310 [Bdellovibrionales bacterium]|nr:hypothetical protein [Bdellovibrionales bacterium]
MSKKIIFILGIIFSISTYAAPIVQEAYLISTANTYLTKLISSHRDLVIDHKTKNKFELYGPKGLGKWLKNIGSDFVPINHFNELKSMDSYPTPGQIEIKLKEIVKKYSNIMTIESIGKTTQNNDLWAIKISDNPSSDELEPEVKYIANMHGNEIVGRELMVFLINDLGKMYNAKDQQVLDLINNTEIYIIPSMNPDGAALRRRGNYKYADLNRDFPDFSTRDNQNNPKNRELETQAIMKLQKERNFSLSVNFHGGAEVVNYPWDTLSDDHPFLELVKDISTSYADLVPGMRNSNEFPGGIVNGYDWYEVNGGMQDWSYYWHNDLQLTVELSNSKWPDYSRVFTYYDDNKQSLINFLEDVHQGAGFVITGESGGEVQITDLDNERNLGSFSYLKNEFYKVLPEGNYQFNITTTENKKYSKPLRVNAENSKENGNFVKIN